MADVEEHEFTDRTGQVWIMRRHLYSYDSIVIVTGPTLSRDAVRCYHPAVVMVSSSYVPTWANMRELREYQWEQDRFRHEQATFERIA